MNCVWCGKRIWPWQRTRFDDHAECRAERLRAMAERGLDNLTWIANDPIRSFVHPVAEQASRTIHPVPVHDRIIGRAR